MRRSAGAMLILLFIATLSYVCSYCMFVYISCFVPVQLQISLVMFCTILVFIDNFSLLQDLHAATNKSVDNPEHIRIIGRQAVEIQKNKMIIYKLCKLNERPIVKHPHTKSWSDKCFNKSF